MANATRFFGFREHAFAWALALSLALHAVLAATLPPFRFDIPKREKALDVELAPPPKAETPPPPPPEPPKLEAVKLEAVKPKPQVRPNPIPAPLPEPVQPVQAVSEPASPPRVESAQQPPAVIAAAPKAEEPPVFVAPSPPPEPPKPTGPSQQDIDAARNNYRNLLARAFDKHRQYPRVAQMRGWEGTVRLQLELDANGNITSSTVIESSGFEVLDKQALETAKKASPLPPPPEALRNRPFSIMVPVTFRLE